MASNIKVDIVRPTATNGSLSLKGDSGGSATANGITVDSSGDTSITGTTTVSQLDADNIRIDGNTISSTNTNGDILITPNGTGDVTVGTTPTINRISGASGNPLYGLVDKSIEVVGSTDTQNYRTGIAFGTANRVGSGIYANNIDVSGSGNDEDTNLEFYTTKEGLANARLAMTIDEDRVVKFENKINVNSITDLAGTGAPDFPNGVTLASNAIVGNITGVTLDDYEEGTWTPTGNNITFASAYGTYIKIGNLVFATYSCQWPSTANADDATINSLPFPVKSSGLGSQGARYGVAPGYINKADVNFTVTATPDSISLKNNLGSTYSNANVSSKIFRGVAIYET